MVVFAAVLCVLPLVFVRRAIRSIMIWGNAYKYVSFEREARENQYDNNYLENCNYFSCVKYYGKNN